MSTRPPSSAQEGDEDDAQTLSSSSSTRTSTIEEVTAQPDDTRKVSTTATITDSASGQVIHTDTSTSTTHLPRPSIPQVVNEERTLPDGMTETKTTTTVVHPGGRREVTVQIEPAPSEHDTSEVTREGGTGTGTGSFSNTAAVTSSSRPSGIEQIFDESEPPTSDFSWGHTLDGSISEDKIVATIQEPSHLEQIEDDCEPPSSIIAGILAGDSAMFKDVETGGSENVRSLEQLDDDEAGLPNPNSLLFSQGTAQFSDSTPSHSSQQLQQRQSSARNATGGDIPAQTETETPAPLDPAQRETSVPILEATLVTDEMVAPVQVGIPQQPPSLPIYDAVQVPHNESGIKKYQLYIFAGLILIIGILAGVLTTTLYNSNSPGPVAPASNTEVGGTTPPKVLDQESGSPSQSPGASDTPAPATSTSSSVMPQQEMESDSPGLTSISPVASTSTSSSATPLEIIDTDISIPAIPDTFAPTSSSITDQGILSEVSTMPTSSIIPPNPAGYLPSFCSWAKPIKLGECVNDRTNHRAPTLHDSCGYTVEYSQWYTFSGTGEFVTASTCNPGTNFDTRISVFESDCDPNFNYGTTFSIVGDPSTTCAGSNDNACGSQSLVTFFAEKGKTYYFGIDGANGSKGKFAFSAFAGSMLQTVNCSPPTCSKAPYCIILEDIYAGTTMEGSTTDKIRGFFDLDMCGDPAMMSASSDEIKGYRFNSLGGSTTVSLCNLEESYSIALQVMRRGCKDDNVQLCPYCHVVESVGSLTCENISFDTELNEEYYLIVTTIPSWWGPSSFTLTVNGHSARAHDSIHQIDWVLVPASPTQSIETITSPPPPTSASPATNLATNQNALCGCSCEVNADEDVEWDCRKLGLLPHEQDIESKCMEYCSSVTSVSIFDKTDCSSYATSEILTCSAEYVFMARCICLNEDRSCEVSDTSYGHSTMSKELCSDTCQSSSRFASTCELQGGSIFVTGTAQGIVTPVFGYDDPEAFGIKLCDEDNDIEECGLSMQIFLDEFNNMCSCSCSGERCSDLLTGISCSNTPIQCAQYCQEKSRCSFDPGVESKLIFN